MWLVGVRAEVVLMMLAVCCGWPMSSAPGENQLEIQRPVRQRQRMDGVGALGARSKVAKGWCSCYCG